MTSIVTIVPGRDSDIEDITPTLAELYRQNLVIPFTDGELSRPVAGVDGLEIQCDPSNYRQVRSAIAAAGFTVVGGSDSSVA